MGIEEAAKQSRYFRNVEPNEQEGYGGHGKINQAKQYNDYGRGWNEVGYHGLTWKFAQLLYS